MSLLSGMNNIFQNTPVMEAATQVAEEDMMLDELSALEADIALEKMTDGNNNPANDDEIDTIVDEDIEEDEINEELDAADECGDCATEAAALTGTSFLRHLTMNRNDPIKTKPGSIGQQDSTASWNTNYSDEYDDDNDPIKTKPGSVGIQDGTANHKENYSDEEDDKNDPIKAKPGTIGQKNSTAKDPAMEGASFLRHLTSRDDIATESSSRVDKSSQKFTSSCESVGVEPIDIQQVNDLLANKDYDGAIEALTDFQQRLSQAEELDDGNDTQNYDYLTIVTEGLLLRVSMNKMYDAVIESGTDAAVAANQIIGKVRGKLQQMQQGNTISARSQKAIESAIKHFEYAAANEADANSGDGDPEYTYNGSVGQKSSKAHTGNNYSSGILDTMDPVNADAGAEGQDDSAATWPDNHSGGYADSSDPVHTADGSVGQKDSTAKDPASESFALDELNALASILDQDFD